jgi:NAD(P)H-dependent FMN reductase
LRNGPIPQYCKKIQNFFALSFYDRPVLVYIRHESDNVDIVMAGIPGYKEGMPGVLKD